MTLSSAVFPDLICSDDEEDPKLHSAMEDMVTDRQVGTILRYSLTSLQSQAPEPRTAATSDLRGGGATAVRMAVLYYTALHCTALHCTAIQSQAPESRHVRWHL